MIWDIEMPSFPRLECDMRCDVLVIGGGMAGVLCARALADKGLDVVVVEAKKLGMGITRRTTAVLTAQHDTLYSDLIKHNGREAARSYLYANLKAVEQYRQLSSKIACDFEERPSYTYSVQDAQPLHNEVQALHSLGFKAAFKKEIELPFDVKGAVEYPGMAQFHPLKLLSGVASRLTVYENTFVQKLVGNQAITEGGVITAKKIVVATHYPFINRVGLYPAKLFQQRSYVLAVENACKLKGTYLQASPNGLYFRDYGDLLLVGGSDHRTGTKGATFGPLREYVRKHHPHATERYAFANQDCVTLDGLPYVGQYSASTPNLYVITGFNLWGMTNSMAASHVMADLITSGYSEFANAYAPKRSMMRAQLLINAGTTMGNLLFPTTKRCPHMGCALKYNKVEHSWDCACHGSRFDKNGKLLENPAMRDSHV